MAPEAAGALLGQAEQSMGLLVHMAAVVIDAGDQVLPSKHIVFEVLAGWRVTLAFLVVFFVKYPAVEYEYRKSYCRSHY